MERARTRTSPPPRPGRHALPRGRPVPYPVSSAIDRESAVNIPPLPLARLIDHIDHIVQVAGIDHAGIDHAGIGSDFDGIPAAPAGLESATGLPTIAHALLERGYTSEDTQKILGGNFLRAFECVQSLSSVTE